MRLLGPITNTAMALAVVVLSFFPWAITVRGPGRYDRFEWGGWQSGVPTDLFIPAWLADFMLPHYYVVIALGLAAVAGWLRYAGVRRVPDWVAVVFTAYAALQMGYYAWLFWSGWAGQLLSYPPAESAWLTIPGYLALLASIVAFGMSLVAWEIDRASAAAPTKR